MNQIPKLNGNELSEKDIWFHQPYWILEYDEYDHRGNFLSHNLIEYDDCDMFLDAINSLTYGYK